MQARAREIVEKKGAPPLERERERGALTEAALVPKTALLADIVFEVVLHQAGLRRLDGPREFIDQKAREHKVERPEAQTAYGNLLVILERGAEESGERQILSAFLTLGLRAQTSRVPRAERRAAFARLLPQFDWLEANSLPSAYLYADEVLDADDASLLWDAVVEATVKGGPRRADALLRVEALRHARMP